jgi:hypothetical protein
MKYNIWYQPTGGQEQTVETTEWATVSSWLNTFGERPGCITIVGEQLPRVIAQEEGDRTGVCATHLWDLPCPDCENEGIMA